MHKSKVAALIAAMAFGSFVGVNSASADITDDRFEQKTQEYLEQLGIADSDVESIRIVVEKRRNDRGPDIIGANSWVRLNSCDKGYLVIQMTRGAFVRQAYTRGDCSVPGLDNH